MSVTSHDSDGEITRWLRQWRAGDRAALDRLMPLVYQPLRRIAAEQLRHEPDSHALEPADLVHALYLRLTEQQRADWANRQQFYAVAAQMMRRTLIDHARRRLAAKRDASLTLSPTALASGSVRDATAAADVLAVEQALARLSARHPESARIVELRFFAGLSIEETADLLGRSPATVKRTWRGAKDWLLRELRVRADG